MVEEKSAGIDVVGLGAATVDVLTLVEHWPVAGEVQRALEVSIQGGGPVATAIVALARLGASTAMLSMLGDDWRAAIIRQEFEREQVHTGFLRTCSGCESCMAAILVRQQDGERSIIYHPGDTPELVFSAEDAALLTQARYLHINGRYLDACLAAARLAHSCGIKVSFDGGAYRYHPALRSLIPLVDLCIVARQFAEQFTGASNLGDMAQSLLDEGPGVVVITDGIRGSWIYSSSDPAFHQPAYRLAHSVDTTGCGDAFHGAFLYGLLEGASLHQAAAIASVVAGLNTRCLGGRAGLPTLAEVQHALQE
ncbi:MAG: hypothetical protein JW726_18380 [Anaerolineales bacterium]|nr:hypothetical protein [Anaerolineales bacterium]